MSMNQASRANAEETSGRAMAAKVKPTDAAPFVVLFELDPNSATVEGVVPSVTPSRDV